MLPLRLTQPSTTCRKDGFGNLLGTERFGTLLSEYVIACLVIEAVFCIAEFPLDCQTIKRGLPDRPWHISILKVPKNDARGTTKGVLTPIARMYKLAQANTK